jgi:putative membrane protein
MTEGFADVNQSIDTQISDLIRSNEEISDSTKAALIKNLNAIVDANLTNLEKSMTAKVEDINRNLVVLSKTVAALAQQANEMSAVTEGMSKNAGNVQQTLNEIKKREPAGRSSVV